MIDQNRRESLNEIVVAVFEQTAFLFLEPADLAGGISFDDMELIQVQISFSGDAEGEVTIVLPLDMCRELSSNLLGEDVAESDERDKSIDAVKEMLNIIAGQLLTKLFGYKALFNLSSPQVTELNREEFFSTLEEKEYTCHSAEEHPVITTLVVKAGAYEH